MDVSRGPLHKDRASPKIESSGIVLGRRSRNLIEEVISHDFNMTSRLPENLTYSYTLGHRYILVALHPWNIDRSVLFLRPQLDLDMYHTSLHKWEVIR